MRKQRKRMMGALPTMKKQGTPQTAMLDEEREWGIP
jgi:hypothetical protein